MRHFSQREIREAITYAAGGGQALHTHRIIGRGAPRCFARVIDAGCHIAHLLDLDAVRLERTARRLGVRTIAIERRGTSRQHIDLCGAPLRRALAQCSMGDSGSCDQNG